MEITRKGVMALAALIGTAVASIPAAADGGNSAYPDQSYYPSIWQGLYAGVHVGFGNGGDGVLGGGQVGYNWQSGRIVYGVEGDFALSSIKDGATACAGFMCASASASLDWMATARGRIGYLLDPRILAYATAGVGFVSWSAEGGITGCPGCTIKLDGTDSGFVFGLGVEGKISETMTARIEFLSGGDFQPDVVRAALNFKLGGN
jgi:outer membrane immunogenic protein